MAKQGWLAFMAPLARGTSQLAPTSAKSFEAALDRARSVIMSSYPLAEAFGTVAPAPMVLVTSPLPAARLDSETGSKPDESR
jgi:hypothetical protein